MLHDGLDGRVARLDLLKRIERPANGGESLLAARQVAALGLLNAMQDAHRLGDRVGDVHQLGGDVVATFLDGIERRRELLARGFGKLSGIRHGDLVRASPALATGEGYHQAG